MNRPEYKIAVTIVYIGGLFIQILDSTVVNVALPAMSEDFGVAVTDVEWVVVGYGLMMAAGIPVAGWFGDRFGPKRVFLLALAVFTVASVLCGAAGSLDELVTFRLLQGLGAGLITPVGSAMLFRAYPLHERATAANAVLSVAVIAPAIGPTLGGLITETLSWRWIFFVNIPIGLFALVLGSLWLRDEQEPHPGRFDIWGFVLASGGLALTMYGLSVAPDHGWTAPITLGTGGLGVTCIVLLVVVETRIEAPILKLQLYRERMFRSINIVGVFVYMGFVSQIFMFTLYMQRLRGYSALEAGLTQSPQAIGVFLFSNLVGRRVYQTVGPRRMLLAGTTGATVITLSFALPGLDTPPPLLALMMLMRGVAMGSIFLAVQASVYARITPADTARATSLFNTQRQASNALGVAVVATVLAALAPAIGVGPESGADGLSAYRGAFLASGLMLMPAIAAAALVRDEDAAATRSQPDAPARN